MKSNPAYSVFLRLRLFIFTASILGLPMLCNGQLTTQDTLFVNFGSAANVTLPLNGAVDVTVGFNASPKGGWVLFTDKDGSPSDLLSYSPATSSKVFFWENSDPDFLNTLDGISEALPFLGSFPESDNGDTFNIGDLFGEPPGALVVHFGAVPEPSTYGFIGAILLFAVAVVRRFKGR